MIPLSTTLIRVWRVPVDSDAEERDPYDPPPPEVFDPAIFDPAIFFTGTEIVVSDVRANISSPAGRERNAGGSQEVVEFSLSSDPIELRNTDQVEDQSTGERYEVVWARQRVGFGLEHTRAGLRQVSGIA